MALGGKCPSVALAPRWQLALGGKCRIWQMPIWANAESGECRIWQAPLGVRIFLSVTRYELTDHPPWEPL